MGGTITFKAKRKNIMKIFQIAIVLISILIAINQSIADSGQSAISLDTITVTANKQEENIQDVPMSITAFDEFTLEDKNITSVRDLTDYVPNLILSDQGVSGSARPVMRGVVAELGTFNVSTAMFVDGIPVLSFNGFEDTLQNIERVEVLRGPQGTLYGKSAEAGAINIITRQPDNTLRGKISVDGGEDYKKDVGFNVSGPIIQDKFFFGVSGKYYSKDGFITNGYTDDEANDEAHWYGKGQFRWTPTDNLDISVIFSQLQYDNDGNTMGLSEDGAASYGWVASGDREVYSDFDTREESKISTQAFKVIYDINDTLNLTSITTHRLFQTDSATDFDFSSVDGLHGTDKSKFDKISQELRLVSNTEKIKGVVGIYYDTDDNSTDQRIETYGTGYDRDHGGKAYAFFGQIRYALMVLLT